MSFAHDLGFPTGNMSDRQVFVENTVSKSHVIPSAKPRSAPSVRSMKRDSVSSSSISISGNAAMKSYITTFVCGMICAAFLIWNHIPITIPQTNVLVSPHPHLTPVYYRVFILNHPFYSPYHATPDDNTLGRFFLVDLAPPYTGQRITDYIVEREHLRPQEISLYANTTSSAPVNGDEIVSLIRGSAPVGNPDEPLMLILQGKSRVGVMETTIPTFNPELEIVKESMRVKAARTVARLRMAPRRAAAAAALFVVSLAIWYAVVFDVIRERERRAAMGI